MDNPPTKRIKTLLLLILVMACVVLPGYSRKHKAEKEEKPEDEATLKLKAAIEHFQKGSSLYESKKLDDAIGEYREALKGDPEEPYWHQALGKALEDKSDLQGALEEYRIASLQSPLDTGLSSKLEELTSKLLGSAEAQNVETKPLKATPVRAAQFKPEEAVTPPRPTYMPEPPYSVKARRVHYKGTATLWIVVDAQGNVTDAQVAKPLGLGLDEKALQTILAWKFKPAMRGDVPVPAHIMAEISFNMW